MDCALPCLQSFGRRGKNIEVFLFLKKNLGAGNEACQCVLLVLKAGCT
jgi:hypothetical protein